MGALPESQVMAFLERLTKQDIGGEEQELLKAADAALVAGDPAGAAETLCRDPGGRARERPCACRTGAVQCGNRRHRGGQSQILAQVPEAKRNDSAVAAARAAIEVAEQAARSGRSPNSKQKVAADPLDHQARFDLAVALNANNRRQEALDHLIEIVRRDRKWNDDGARKQLVQFFEAWGPTDEHTVAGRRRLSSILFA